MAGASASKSNEGQNGDSQNECGSLAEAQGGGRAGECKWTQTWSTVGVSSNATATLPYFPSVANQSTGIILPGIAVAPPIPPPSGTTTTAARFANTTIRQIVKVSIGGEKVRLRLSNAFGSADLKVDELHVASWDPAACPEPLAPVPPATVSRGRACSNVVAGTDTPVPLNGSTSFVVPAGQEVYTDAVAFPTPAFGSVAVSVYFKDLTPALTTHGTGITSSYRVVGLPGTDGNLTSAKVFDAPTLKGTAALATSTNTVVLVGLDVLAPRKTRAIVAFGDSITDGSNSTPETTTRWSNFLARRLADLNGREKTPPAVSNAGIAGNKVAMDNANAGFGISATRRFQRDVLSRSGVSDVIVLEGINDIGQNTQYTESADNILAAYRNLIQQAHATGVKIYFATITPIRTDVATAAGTYTGLFSQSQALFDVREPVRQAVNQWILTTNEHDGAIDFNRAVSAPGLLNQLYAPHSLNLLTGGNDQLHPNSNGYEVMAAAIELKWFK